MPSLVPVHDALWEMLSLSNRLFLAPKGSPSRGECHRWMGAAIREFTDTETEPQLRFHKYTIIRRTFTLLMRMDLESEAGFLGILFHSGKLHYPQRPRNLFCSSNITHNMRTS